MPIMNGFKACKTITNDYSKYLEVKKGKKVPLLKKLTSKSCNKLEQDPDFTMPKRSQSF